jgi:hypothetical protein
VVEAAAELTGVLFGLVQVGTDSGPGGQLPTSLGREVTEEAGEGGEVDHGDDQFVGSKTLRRVGAGSGEGVDSLGDVVVDVVIHWIVPF